MAKTMTSDRLSSTPPGNGDLPPMRPEEILNHSGDWSLKCDLQLLSTLKSLSGSLFDHATGVSTRINKLSHDVDEKVGKVCNVINDLQMLASSQFIENRVLDEEDVEVTPSTSASATQQQSSSPDMMTCVRDSVRSGLSFVERDFIRVLQAKERMQPSREDDSDDEETDILNHELFKVMERNKFSERSKLPPLIGSSEYAKLSFASMFGVEEESYPPVNLSNIETEDAIDASTTILPDVDEEKEDDQESRHDIIISSSSDEDDFFRPTRQKEEIKKTSPPPLFETSISPPNLFSDEDEKPQEHEKKNTEQPKTLSFRDELNQRLIQGPSKVNIPTVKKDDPHQETISDSQPPLTQVHSPVAVTQQHGQKEVVVKQQSLISTQPSNSQTQRQEHQKKSSIFSDDESDDDFDIFRGKKNIPPSKISQSSKITVPHPKTSKIFFSDSDEEDNLPFGRPTQSSRKSTLTSAAGKISPDNREESTRVSQGTSSELDSKAVLSSKDRTAETASPPKKEGSNAGRESQSIPHDDDANLIIRSKEQSLTESQQTKSQKITEEVTKTTHSSLSTTTKQQQQSEQREPTTTKTARPGNLFADDSEEDSDSDLFDSNKRRKSSVQSVGVSPKDVVTQPTKQEVVGEALSEPVKTRSNQPPLPSSSDSDSDHTIPSMDRKALASKLEASILAGGPSKKPIGGVSLFGDSKPPPGKTETVKKTEEKRGMVETSPMSETPSSSPPLQMVRPKTPTSPTIAKHDIRKEDSSPQLLSSTAVKSRPKITAARRKPTKKPGLIAPTPPTTKSSLAPENKSSTKVSEKEILHPKSSPSGKTSSLFSDDDDDASNFVSKSNKEEKENVKTSVTQRSKMQEKEESSKVTRKEPSMNEEPVKTVSKETAEVKSKPATQRSVFSESDEDEDIFKSSNVKKATVASKKPLFSDSSEDERKESAKPPPAPVKEEKAKLTTPTQENTTRKQPTKPTTLFGDSDSDEELFKRK